MLNINHDKRRHENYMFKSAPPAANKPPKATAPVTIGAALSLALEAALEAALVIELA